MYSMLPDTCNDILSIVSGEETYYVLTCPVQLHILCMYNTMYRFVELNRHNDQTPNWKEKIKQKVTVRHRWAGSYACWSILYLSTWWADVKKYWQHLSTSVCKLSKQFPNTVRLCVCFWVHISMYGYMFSRAQMFDQEFLKCHVFTFIQTKNCLSQTNTLIYTHVSISSTNSGPVLLVTSVVFTSY